MFGRDKNQVPFEHQPDELSFQKHSSTQYLIFTTKLSVRSTSLLHRQSVQHNYENQDHRVSALSPDTRTPHKTRLSPISAQSCYNRILTILTTVQIRGGADKSLARPGRKQATATKLGIYSTYSPRRSIHFLARCSNFCKSLKKKNQKVIRPTRSPRQQWPLRRTKNGDLSLVFSVQETVAVRRGQIRRIGWVIKILEAQVGQFLLGCKCPVSRGIVVQE